MPPLPTSARVHVNDREMLRKRRRTVGDNRVRPEHALIAIETAGEGIPFDAPYSNGEVV